MEDHRLQFQLFYSMSFVLTVAEALPHHVFLKLLELKNGKRKELQQKSISLSW